MSTRREIRARVLQALYAHELSGDDAQQMAEILDKASARSEWAEISEQESF